MGKETAWNNVNKINEARYFDVKPGYYSFVLQEINGVKVLNQKKIDFTYIAYNLGPLKKDFYAILWNLFLLAVFNSFIKSKNNHLNSSKSK